MRLMDRELQAIAEVFKQTVGQKGSIYLFGSRVDAHKKGGDIDLLLLFKNGADLSGFDRLDFLVKLKSKIGERKIDLTLSIQADSQLDPFIQSILPTAVKI